MIHQVLLTFVVVASVWAQSNHVIHGWEYFGCVETTANAFETTVTFGGGYTPELCQSACVGFAYAATFNDACRCGNNIDKTSKQDESICNMACNGDPTLGFCGFIRQDGCALANLYIACDVIPPMAPSNPPATSLPSTQMPPSPLDTTTCTEGNGSSPPGTTPAMPPSPTISAGTSVVVIYTTAQPPMSCTTCPNDPGEAGVMHTVTPPKTPVPSSSSPPSVPVLVPAESTGISTAVSSSIHHHTSTYTINGSTVASPITSAATPLTKVDGDPTSTTTTFIPARGNAFRLETSLFGIFLAAVVAAAL